ncbi:MAG: hypothetical protein ACOX2F_09130 [bacterium]
MKKVSICLLTVFFIVFAGCSDKKKSETDAEKTDNAVEESDDPTFEDPDDYGETPDDVKPDDAKPDDVKPDDAKPDDGEKDDFDGDLDNEPVDDSNEEPDDNPVVNVKVIFVDLEAKGKNDGSSWQNAFTELQPAINAAEKGDSIWIAKGIYYPTSVHDIVTADEFVNEEEFNQYKHFRLKGGVEVYGGFKGNETDTSERTTDLEDEDYPETILSCDIGVADDSSDNCFHLFFHPEELKFDEPAVLDRVIMVGGVAAEDKPHNSGGAMYNDGSNIILKDCAFYENVAYFGSGGAIYNKNSTIEIVDSVFIDNSSYGDGQLEDAIGGGAIYNENSVVEIIDSHFRINYADSKNSHGGAIFSIGGTTVIKDSSFSRNTASIRGGAVSVVSGELKIYDLEFEENKACDGGVIYIDKGDALISDCHLDNNTTYGRCESGDGRGGGIYLTESTLKVLNSIFSRNISEEGGAIYSTSNGEQSKITIINSAFSKNQMITNGGAIYSRKTDISVANSLFYRNIYSFSQPGTQGGAIYKTLGSLDVVNSIFQRNAASSGTGNFYPRDDSEGTSVTYSCVVQDASYPGEGNINEDPYLVDPEWPVWNFYPKKNSPCIDAGSNVPFDAGNIAEGITKDMKGNDRIMKGKSSSTETIVDMGPIETEL